MFGLLSAAASVVWNIGKTVWNTGKSFVNGIVGSFVGRNQRELEIYDRSDGSIPITSSGENQQRIEVLKCHVQELQLQAALKEQDAKLQAEIQQKLEILKGEINKEYLLLKFSQERELAFEKSEIELDKQEYLAMLEKVWPLILLPREYNKFSKPNSEGQITLSILIDNRTPNCYGELYNSLWNELEDCLNKSFMGGCPIYFNSNIFEQNAVPAGVATNTLHNYSKHIPTLVLVPTYTDKELVLDVKSWGFGNDRMNSTKFFIPINEQLIEIARTKINEEASIYDTPEEMSPTFRQYWELFKREKEKLAAGKTVEQLLKTPFYNSLIKVDSQKPNDIQIEVFNQLSKFLAHEIFLPIGQTIDAYAINEYGLTPRLPLILNQCFIEKSQSTEILSDYVKNLVNVVRAGQSTIGKEQLEKFKKYIAEADFDEQEELNNLLDDLAKSLIMPVKTFDKPDDKVENIPPELKELYHKAVQGDVEAQYNLANNYTKGIGVDEDNTEAVKWFRKAAEQGHVESQAKLGICYAKGIGVDEDDKEAMKWLRKAAEQENGEAQVALSICYAHGKGVHEDLAEAMKWIRKAADHLKQQIRGMKKL